jgi:hypothetical protein
VEHTANKWSVYLGKEAFCNSLVKINAPKGRAIGCFVSPKIILTCLHPFGGIGVENLEIISIDDRKRYEATAKKAEYPDIDLLVIEVKVGSYRNRACVELDFKESSLASDSFGIYSTNSSDLIPLSSSNREFQPLKKLELSVEQVEQREEFNPVGSPIVNKRTGKVCGIVSSLQGDSTSKIVKVISVTEMVDKLPDLRSANEYINSVSCNLPEREEREFIGRQDELQDLYRYLAPSHTQHITEINGVAGIGKTSLVVEIAHQCLLSHQKIRSKSKIPIFDAVIFVSLANVNLSIGKNESDKDNDAGLIRIVKAIGDTLKVPRLNEFAEAGDFTPVYKALSRKPTLLILDGWEDVTATKPIWNFLNKLKFPTKVIITARKRKESYNCILLSPFTEKQVEDYIQQQLRSKYFSLNPEKISKIVKSVPGIPLVLTQAIDNFSADELEDYADLDIANADRAKFNIDRAIDSISSTNTLAILQVLSFFATSASVDATVYVSSKMLVSGQAQELDEALEKLEQLGLVLKSKSARGKTAYTLPSIVRERIFSSSDRSAKNTFSSNDREARSRWVKWYCDFVKSHPTTELEDEWENIKAVLNWCREQRDFSYVPFIREIWLNVDLFVMNKKYWSIRAYWWEYLLKEYSLRQDELFCVEVRLALSDTYSKKGDPELSQKYFTEASESMEEILQAKKKYLSAGMANIQLLKN